MAKLEYPALVFVGELFCPSKVAKKKEQQWLMVT